MTVLLLGRDGSRRMIDVDPGFRVVRLVPDFSPVGSLADYLDLSYVPPTVGPPREFVRTARREGDAVIYEEVAP